MLEDLLQQKYSDEDDTLTNINLSYTELTTLSSVSYKYKHILNLTINHSYLACLAHIQQFDELQSLSVKYNNISNIKQILRIKNKEKILSLNFKGNDIEHYQAARINEMKKHFKNLVELNGVDYRFMEISKIGVDKPIENIRLLHRLDTMGMVLDSLNKTEVQEKVSVQKEMTSNKKGKENQPTQRKRQLQISTGQIQNVNHQPCTATFAKQKQIEQKIPFGFKKQIGLSRIQRKSQHSLMMDISMKYASNNIFNTSNQSMGLFPEINQKVGQNRQLLAEAHYYQYILSKLFYGWKDLVGDHKQSKEDRPVRKEWPSKR